MAYPIDPKEGFLRTPAVYPHDAFGVDTGGRVRPHSGSDSTPRVAKARARSVLGGTVNRTGYSIYAGNWVEVLAPDGWLWLDIHLASQSVKPGDVVPPGGELGIVGNTGGGGSGPLAGKARLATHLHTSRCRNEAASNRIIRGLVRARWKGETREQWAAAHGLSDPYPHITESLKARAPIEEEDDVALTAKQQEALDWLGDLERRKRIDTAIYIIGQQLGPRIGVIDEIGADVNALEWLSKRQEQEDVEAFQLAELFGRLGIIDRIPFSAGGSGASAAEIAEAVAAKLDVPGIGAEQVSAIAKAVADEQAKRLAS